MADYTDEDHKKWKEKIKKERDNDPRGFPYKFRGLPTPDSGDAMADGHTTIDEVNYLFAYKALQVLLKNEDKQKEIDNAGMILIRDAIKSKIRDDVSDQLISISKIINVPGIEHFERDDVGKIF
jgi:hypothetical protein